MNKTKILIVEDEAIVAADLAGKLKQLGYEVAGTASEGLRAIELAEHLCPDLVLMDIKLEGEMDGIQASERLVKTCDLPVIYLTAHSDAATLERAKVTGPSGYILKPFEERELATQIELALYRHGAEKEIREQREWFRVTLTSIGDAVIAVDTEEKVNFLNPVAESLTGWKMEEAQGQPLSMVFPIINEVTLEEVKNPVSKVLQSGLPVALANHTALITKDDRSMPVEDSAAPIKDAAGGIIGVVLVFHDVTEKRRAEEALQEAHDNLDKKVRERTAELEWKNRELQEFAYVASHDLQEPLRKIKLFEEMVEKELKVALSDQGKDYLRRMNHAADRMQRLIKSLLSYSRTSANKSPYERVDLKPVAEVIARDLLPEETGLTPVIEIADLPAIDADPVQMHQLLQNLIANAIHYHKEGQVPIVKISSSVLGRTCKLIIEDNGIGFDMAYVDKIFLPFERLNARNKYDGTGMGLAICRKIAELHGGRIEARSTPGEGATFIVTLPMRQTNEPE